MYKQCFIPRRLLRILMPVMFAVTLSGCIVVQDFGTYWNKGTQDTCILQIVEITMLEGNARGVPTAELARTLKLGPHRFLMLRDRPNDIGGNLYRYEVKNGEYIAYRLNNDMQQRFLERYGNNKLVTLTNETATISQLNDESVKLLQAVAAEPDYWIVADRRPYNPAQRRDCAEKPTP